MKTLALLYGIVAFALGISNTAESAGPEPAKPDTRSFCEEMYCYETGFCNPGEHTTNDGPTILPLEGVNHDLDCAPGGDCEIEHPYCDGSDVDELTYEELESAWKRRDAAGMERLLTAYPEVIRISRLRSAIQVLNCKGNVVANLPVQQDLIGVIGSN